MVQFMLMADISFSSIWFLGKGSIQGFSWLLCLSIFYIKLNIIGRLWLIEKDIIIHVLSWNATFLLNIVP